MLSLVFSLAKPLFSMLFDWVLLTGPDVLESVPPRTEIWGVGIVPERV